MARPYCATCKAGPGTPTCSACGNQCPVCRGILYDIIGCPDHGQPGDPDLSPDTAPAPAKKKYLRKPKPKKAKAPVVVAPAVLPAVEVTGTWLYPDLRRLLVVHFFREGFRSSACRLVGPGVAPRPDSRYCEGCLRRIAKLKTGD